MAKSINLKELFEGLVSEIGLDEDPAEARAIVSLLMEKVAGVSFTDVLAGRMMPVTPEMSRLLDEYVARIRRHEPVQYVIQEAVFFGRTFRVDRSVLIPRPETEELVRVVLEYRDLIQASAPVRILDAGTGSGCIAITLALEWPGAEVFGVDISEQALTLARGNATAHGVGVHFLQGDLLEDDLPVDELQVVVSNPPYIARKESSEMHRRVLDFEPDIALFVPDEDPLIFYKALSTKSWKALRAGGLLAVEINENYDREVCELLTDAGWRNVTVVRDIAGKPRVVKAIR